MSVGLAGDSANRKGSQRVCVCTCFAWHRRNDGNNGQDTQECMNLTYFYTTYLSTKNDFKNFMSNLNPSPVRSDHVSNGPCQYCTVFRLGSPAYRTPSSFRMKSRPAAACPDSESRCLEIRDLAAAHPKRPTRGGRGREEEEGHTSYIKANLPYLPLRRRKRALRHRFPFNVAPASSLS